MKQITAGLALALAMTAAGCGGSSKKGTTPAAGDATCAGVAASTEQHILTAGGTEPASEERRPIAAAARATVDERCPADGWSQEAIACLAVAKGEQFEECSKLLTAEQTRSLEEEMKRKLHDLGEDDADGGAEGMKQSAPPPAGAAPPDDPCGGED
jgi:hypothetical protein